MKLSFEWVNVPDSTSGYGKYSLEILNRSSPAVTISDLFLFGQAQRNFSFFQQFNSTVKS